MSNAPEATSSNYNVDQVEVKHASSKSCIFNPVQATFVRLVQGQGVACLLQDLKTCHHRLQLAPHCLAGTAAGMHLQPCHA